MPDIITELDEFGAEKVSGVGAPANGTPWLLLKAEGVEASPVSPHTTSPEADEFEDEVTKAEAEEIEAMLTKARFAGFCGTDDCGVCKERFGPLYEQIMAKSKLKAADRKALPSSAFVFPKDRKYPIHDESHARNALSRASGKPEEAKVRSAVHKRYPGIGAEKSTGVPDESVKTPKEAKHLATGNSEVAGPMTDGVRHDHGDPSFSHGGENSYVIPTEARINDNPPAPPPMDRPGEGNVVVKDDWTIEVVDKANWISDEGDDDEAAEKTEAPPEASTTPGDAAWQEYDAATLDAAARGLAEAKMMVDHIRQREAVEAVSGNPSEWMDAYQLSCAGDDICSALGLVAALAYREAASGECESATKSLASTQSQIGQLMARLRPTPAVPGDRTSEEENSMATITKEELDAEIAAKAKEAAGEMFAEMKAKDKKAKAKKAKAAKERAEVKKAKAILRAVKNANNGGDISAQEMEHGVHGTHDANDVGSVGHGVRSEYKNAKKGKKVKKEKGSTNDEVLTLLKKMAARPRSGGPVLDGQSRGAFPASEGRTSEPLTKEAVDGDIEKLEKAMETELDGPRKMQLGETLTLLRLKKGHETGAI